MATSASEAVASDGGDGVSMAVLEAVSEATGTSALDLPPLYEAIDPEALDALFDGRRAARRAEFSYAGYVVTVGGNGTVDVSPVD